jgi:hypothetical protein
MPSPEALAECKELWRREAEALEAMPIGSQSIGDDKRIASVVFGATQSKTVSESVHLFRVDGKHSECSHEKSLDDGAMRFLESDEDAARVLLGEVDEPVDG